jgi:hypothetical protein
MFCKTADTTRPPVNNIVATNSSTFPSTQNLQDLIDKAKFSDDKFYSRLSLGNGDDIIQVLTGHGKLVTTLKHDAKAAVVIKDVLYDESEVAGLSPSKKVFFKGDYNGAGVINTASARRIYPDLDLSKYQTVVIVDGTKDLTLLHQPVYSP